jgi:CO/xanthine dehydrogenase Mo-binding subunit
MPLTDSARSAPVRSSAPVAISRTVGSLTAPWVMGSAVQELASAAARLPATSRLRKPSICRPMRSASPRRDLSLAIASTGQSSASERSKAISASRVVLKNARNL